MKHKHINIYTNTSTSRQRKYVIWTNCVENWISDFVLFVLSGFSEELVLTCTVKVGGHEIMAGFQERSLHPYIESSFYSNFQVRSKKKLRARLIDRYFALFSVCIGYFGQGCNHYYELPINPVNWAVSIYRKV